MGIRNEGEGGVKHFPERRSKAEIFRLAGEPIQVEVRDGGTVKDVFAVFGSGKVLGQDSTLMAAADVPCRGMRPSL